MCRQSLIYAKAFALNKNKLQKGVFSLQRAKSVGEYIRTLRMERALEFFGKKRYEYNRDCKSSGYHGVSNFYHAFRQKFGETPQTVP